VATITCARRGRPSCAQPCAEPSSSTTAAAADHAFRLTGTALPAWTTRTPTAAATRSSSARSPESASTASTPRAVVIGIGPPCRHGYRRASRFADFVDRVAAVHTAPTTTGPRNCPTKGTTPARGGGGEGRRVSAPGGRADTPSAKPSDPYYTHDSVTQRKGCQPEISNAFK
jgi:hypothetical protein